MAEALVEKVMHLGGFDTWGGGGDPSRRLL